MSLCVFSGSGPQALIERLRAVYPAPKVLTGAVFEVPLFVVEVLFSRVVVCLSAGRAAGADRARARYSPPPRY